MAKPKRKNRFKKNRSVNRGLLRRRIASGLRVLGGLLFLAATSAAFILAHDYFTQADQFTARQIEVTGNRRLSREQVLDIAEIGEDTNILSLNLTTARKRLLAEPWIAEATVSRDIPSGLTLRITEEQSLAFLEMENGEGFLINAEGRAFKRQGAEGVDGLPRVLGLSHADLPVAGQPATEAFEAVMCLLTLAKDSDGPLSLSSIHRIQVDREIGITAVAGEANRAVKLGFGQYRQKYDILKKILAKMEKDSRLNTFRIIDLFDLDRIVVTLASAVVSDGDDKEV
ncbi:FtsQ-type POTRA domain-containing protein [uncultured Desulfosarcina sp.]|uniref:cell division protein FtsQ/DivIB n=1 Tax=uncultured Desulfosarcina sp. TaxID=218289 RepID=UPI0029C7C299|nr:FtsQ-type POTRA domain-containing protein [uncultured Desulfosarcina sp.]